MGSLFILILQATGKPKVRVPSHPGSSSYFFLEGGGGRGGGGGGVIRVI